LIDVTIVVPRKDRKYTDLMDEDLGGSTMTTRRGFGRRGKYGGDENGIWLERGKYGGDENGILTMRRKHGGDENGILTMPGKHGNYASFDWPSGRKSVRSQRKRSGKDFFKTAEMLSESLERLNLSLLQDG
jgi:hypothetical protein